jgi:hypothetical protein
MQGRAAAVTIQELLDFKGKLSDDVLVALIESDGSVFHLSIADVAALKEKGLSEKVILAMLKTATKPQPMSASQPVAGPPQPVYTPPPADPYGQPAQYPPDQPQMISSDVPDQSQSQPKAPVVVNVRQDVTQHVDQPQQNTQPGYSPYYSYPLGYYQYGGFIGAPVVTRPVVPAAPVYWGWGGQRRPDSWQPAPAPHIPNQAISPMNQSVSPMNQPSTTRSTTTTGRGRGGG